MTKTKYLVAGLVIVLTSGFLALVSSDNSRRNILVAQKQTDLKCGMIKDKLEQHGIELLEKNLAALPASLKQKLGLDEYELTVEKSYVVANNSDDMITCRGTFHIFAPEKEEYQRDVDYTVVRLDDGSVDFRDREDKSPGSASMYDTISDYLTPMIIEQVQEADQERKGAAIEKSTRLKKIIDTRVSECKAKFEFHASANFLSTIAIVFDENGINRPEKDYATGMEPVNPNQQVIQRRAISVAQNCYIDIPEDLRSLTAANKRTFVLF